MIRPLLVAASSLALLTVAACGEGGAGGSQAARSGIWAAGSSTVFPFATRGAENFGRNNPGGAA